MRESSFDTASAALQLLPQPQTVKELRYILKSYPTHLVVKEDFQIVRVRQFLSSTWNLWNSCEGSIEIESGPLLLLCNHGTDHAVH